MSYLPSKSSGQTHVAEILKMMPYRGKLLLALHEDVMRGPSMLSPAERELIFAFNSGLNGCDYCRLSHLHAAAELGEKTSNFEELYVDLEVAPINDRMKPILRFVRKLTLSPSKIDQSDADAIFASGWDEQSFLDVVLICGLSNLMNRLVDGTGVDLGEDSGLLGGKQLARISYAGIAARLFGSDWAT